MNKPHLTAIKRNKPSVPTRFLSKKNLLNYPVLDYGCGRGFDAEYYGFDKYDPYYFDGFNNLKENNYKTIICNYVFNVISPNFHAVTISIIKKLLTKNGIAYICVRRDIPKKGKQGKSFQYFVELDLPIEKETSTYCIYRLSKE